MKMTLVNIEIRSCKGKSTTLSSSSSNKVPSTTTVIDHSGLSARKFEKLGPCKAHNIAKIMTDFGFIDLPGKKNYLKTFSLINILSLQKAPKNGMNK